MKNVLKRKRKILKNNLKDREKKIRAINRNIVRMVRRDNTKNRTTKTKNI